ncbi:hypothetical protein [Corynebacterium lowii]|uniref:Uncharacterized protein n=1 Tax=Corynebacterium lowii TaxID=1544413 RepID=A0A0Q1DX38_9CORY|nr:hypothetical protein [Corynebacterium lowii]KQB84788.1 hypothetical protein Clow_02047 [Corynebacterium lowii]MDP9851691.1 hypothetical protein [Corynebacterium lowii]
MTDNKSLPNAATFLGDGDSILTLRFVGKEEDGSPLHELRAMAVAEVLQGVTELEEDFADAGVFHDSDTVGGTEVFVRPAKEGSFIIEIAHFIEENEQLIALGGVPTIGQILWWVTK